MFIVGDRVRVINDPDGEEYNGLVGTITENDGDTYRPLRVKMENIGRMSESMRDNHGEYGFWYDPDNLELVTDEPFRAALPDETLRLIRHTLLAITASTDPVAARLADMTLTTMESDE